MHTTPPSLSFVIPCGIECFHICHNLNLLLIKYFHYFFESISLSECVLWPRFNTQIYVPELQKNAWLIVSIITSNDPLIYMTIRARTLTVHPPPFGE